VRTDAAATEIKRRRECLRCRHRWTTIETTQEQLQKLEQIRDVARPLAELVR
jgi:transcriptional regulator NrdR family protein